MESSNPVKDIVRCNKEVVDSSFQTLDNIQDQVEMSIKCLMAPIPGLPTPARVALDYWFLAIKNGRREIKAILDQGYNQALGE